MKKLFFFVLLIFISEAFCETEQTCKSKNKCLSGPNGVCVSKGADCWSYGYSGTCIDDKGTCQVNM